MLKYVGSESVWLAVIELTSYERQILHKQKVLKEDKSCIDMVFSRAGSEMEMEEYTHYRD